jgi:hypothetical protein
MSDRRRRSSPSRFRLAQHRFLDDNKRHSSSTNSLHQQLLLQKEKIVRSISKENRRRIIFC